MRGEWPVLMLSAALNVFFIIAFIANYHGDLRKHKAFEKILKCGKCQHCSDIAHEEIAGGSA